MSKPTKLYNSADIKKIEGSQIEIVGSVDALVFNSYRAKALENINKSVEIDGFRKGNVPEKILSAKVGEKTILEEMAEIALSEIYPAIVADNSLDPLGRPEIRITKIALDNPFEFIIKTAVMPEIILGDYKKIAKEIPAPKTTDLEVRDTDVEEAIDRIRKSQVDHAGHNHEKMTTEEKLEHDKSVESLMPELTDAFVQKLGDFKDVSDFKEKIKKALIEDKKHSAREKRRIQIAEKISASSNVDLPQILIKNEVSRIEAQFKDDVTHMGSTLEDYLKRANKTIDELHKEWAPHAEKKAKLQLLLNKIASTEKIKAETKEIEQEVAHILEHYKEADPERARIYAEGVLTNDKVFQFLEQQN